MAHILYVEDHPPAQLLMRAIIGDMTAHRLAVAATGREALASAATDPPDLYIVDLDLPDMDGMALIRALKAAYPAPALLVSAYAESVDSQALGDLVFAYLAKPLDPNDVAHTVERALA
ncbi:MAG: response regulator [Anaerolineae bacterium]|nr:response regulator [Anaerolineae bacterium]